MEIPIHTCKGDGFCNVYEEDDEGKPQRAEGTEWCSCTKEMCIVSCPNEFLCGASEIPLWYKNIHRGTCMNCAVMFGMSLTTISSNGLECSVCLEEHKTLVEWPGCPGKHTFCVPCTTRMHYGHQQEDEGVQSGWGEVEESTGRFHVCPKCRHLHVPQWKLES